MKILILGADGYLGWPICMDLSHDHEVIAIDNYRKRNQLETLNILPLFEVPVFSERVSTHFKETGKDIRWDIADCSDPWVMDLLIQDYMPDCVIHLAEECSAPYSMSGQREANDTLWNNLNSTMNLIHAIKDNKPDCHIIKIGTMGEYGTPNIDIEEGWLGIKHKGREDRLLYPKTPHSLYHLSKVHDSDALAFATRMWSLSVTDLNQGFVYGIETKDMTQEGLRTRFCYDGTFGTVLNRFIVQAVAGYPLTVYGKGDQTRGALNLIDTVACVRLSVENPAKEEFRVFNQFTEQWSINELADLVSTVGNHLGYKTTINHVENPRVEKEKHYYKAAHTSLQELGLKPHLLTEGVVAHMLTHVEQHRENIKIQQIGANVSWKNGLLPARKVSSAHG